MLAWDVLSLIHACLSLPCPSHLASNDTHSKRSSMWHSKLVPGPPLTISGFFFPFWNILYIPIYLAHVYTYLFYYPCNMRAKTMYMQSLWVRGEILFNTLEAWDLEQCLWYIIKFSIIISSVQFSSSVMSDSLWPHEPLHAMSPCPSPTPRMHPNPCPLSRWCHPTISSSLSPSPPALNLSQHQGLFKWISSLHQVAKVLEFQLHHQSFQWTPRTNLL